MNRSIRQERESPRSGCPPRSQAFVEAIEGWKKCTIATFGWLGLLIAVTVALIIEVGAVKRVWGEMFPTPADRSVAPRNPSSESGRPRGTGIAGDEIPSAADERKTSK